MFDSRNNTTLYGDQSRHCDVCANGLHQKNWVLPILRFKIATVLTKNLDGNLLGPNLPLCHYLLTITNTDPQSLTGSEVLALTGFYRILSGTRKGCSLLN